MKIEYWPIDKPVPYARNARKIPQSAIDKVAASIKEFGWRQPIVVDREGVIVIGHTRQLAARKLGQKEVPVHVATDLTPGQIKALRLMDNRSHQEATWDEELLGPELLDLKSLGFDLDLTGFETKELDALLKPPSAADPQPKTEAADELRAKWGTKPGQVWKIGGHRLMIGDSASPADVQRLMAGERADGICTDPPWELEASEVVRCLENFGNVAIVMVGDPQAFDLARHWRFRQDFIWKRKKARGIPNKNLPLFYHAHCLVLTRTDLIASPWKRPKPDWGSVIECEREYEDSVFGHGKASEIFERMLEGFDWKRVADPFAGSGATILACESHGRRCFAMELDPAHAAVALERCADAHLKPELEGSTPPETAATPSKTRPAQRAMGASPSGKRRPA